MVLIWMILMLINIVVNLNMSFDDLIPKGDFARFVVLIVDSLLKTFNLENELFPSAKDNKKAYSINKNVIISIL